MGSSCHEIAVIIEVRDVKQINNVFNLFFTTQEDFTIFFYFLPVDLRFQFVFHHARRLHYFLLFFTCRLTWTIKFQTDLALAHRRQTSAAMDNDRRLGPRILNGDSDAPKLVLDLSLLGLLLSFVLTL